MSQACDTCLRRASLLAELAPHLEAERHRVEAALALPDDQLIESVGGRRKADIRAAHAHFDADSARAGAAGAGLETICRCDRAYPARLRQHDSAPAVLHVAGGMDRFLAF